MKEVYHKVYDKTGVFITAWDDASEPVFDWNVNGSLGELKVFLARSHESFGEGVDVKEGNEVQISIVDAETAEGEEIIVYSGWISEYKPIIKEGRYLIEVTVLPYITETQDQLYRADPAATYTDTSKDPSQHLLDILSERFSTYGGKIRADAGSVSMTGTTTLYPFLRQTYLSCIDVCHRLCPPGWYWYQGADNKIYLRPKTTEATHSLTINKEIKEITPVKRIENVKNTVLFMGGIQAGTDAKIYKRYENAASRAIYGEKAETIIDERVVTIEAADKLATKFMNERLEPEIRCEIVVKDSTEDPDDGYNIESFRPGDTVVINNPEVDSEGLVDSVFYKLDNILWQITKIKWSPKEAKIYLATILPEIDKQVVLTKEAVTNTVAARSKICSADIADAQVRWWHVRLSFSAYSTVLTTLTTTSTSYVDVTGATLSVAAQTRPYLVEIHGFACHHISNRAFQHDIRVIGTVGDSLYSYFASVKNTDATESECWNYRDIPANTAATFKMQHRVSGGTGTILGHGMYRHIWAT